MAKKTKDYGTGIPRQEIESLARLLLLTIRRSLRAKRASRSLRNGRRNRLGKRRERLNDKTHTMGTDSQPSPGNPSLGDNPVRQL